MSRIRVVHIVSAKLELSLNLAEVQAVMVGVGEVHVAVLNDTLKLKGVSVPDEVFQPFVSAWPGAITISDENGAWSGAFRRDGLVSVASTPGSRAITFTYDDGNMVQWHVDADEYFAEVFKNAQRQFAA